MTFLKKWGLALVIVLFAVIGVMAIAHPGGDSAATESKTTGQDVNSLDRRISSLEQRLYSIESRIDRLQQNQLSQRSPVSEPSTRDPEVARLQGEIQTLQLRLSEVECGLVKIDERTISAAVRRSEGVRNIDPCRLNPAAPLRLSDRP